MHLPPSPKRRVLASGSESRNGAEGVASGSKLLGFSWPVSGPDSPCILGRGVGGPAAPTRSLLVIVLGTDVKT